MLKKKNSGRSRKLSRFGSAMEGRLLAYTTSAIAASVTSLAFVQPTEAEVVYTPTNQNLFANGGMLDLNNDGVADFQFFFYSGTDHTSFWVAAGAAWYVRAEGGNAIRGASSALPGEILVGRNSQKFRGPGEALIAGWYRASRLESGTWVRSFRTDGNFANKPNRYLAFQFSVNGETHYGWARLSVSVGQSGMSAFLTGYAYETTPNSPIFTGNEFGNEAKRDYDGGSSNKMDTQIDSNKPRQGASLGHLARGAQGLTMWREKAPNTVK